MDAAATDEVWVEFHSSLEAFESRRFRVEWTATPLPEGRPQPLKGLGLVCRCFRLPIICSEHCHAHGRGHGRKAGLCSCGRMERVRVTMERFVQALR